MRRIGLLFLTVTMLTGPALAAPFCVKVTGLPDQCLYVDPAACQREANRAGGRCTTNAREMPAPVAALPYCLAQPGNVMSCVYPAFADCDLDARRRGGTCVASQSPKGPAPVQRPGQDPFAVTRP